MRDHTAYMRKWRTEHPDLYEKAARAKNAQRRALSRLGRMYPRTLASLVNQERAKAGLPLLGEETNAPKSPRRAV